MMQSMCAMQSTSGSNIYSNINSNKTQLQELYGTAHSMVQMKSILVKRKRKSTMKRSRKRIMMSKSSPPTHKNNHTLAMVQTVYLPPMQIIQKLMLQRFLKRAQIILIIPKTALLLILPLL